VGLKKQKKQRKMLIRKKGEHNDRPDSCRREGDWGNEGMGCRGPRSTKPVDLINEINRRYDPRWRRKSFIAQKRPWLRKLIKIFLLSLKELDKIQGTGSRPEGGI